MKKAQTWVVGGLLALGAGTFSVTSRCRPDQPMTRSAQAAPALRLLDAGSPDTGPLPIARVVPDRPDAGVD